MQRLTLVVCGRRQQKADVAERLNGWTIWQTPTGVASCLPSKASRVIRTASGSVSLKGIWTSWAKNHKRLDAFWRWQLLWAKQDVQLSQPETSSLLFRHSMIATDPFRNASDWLKVKATYLGKHQWLNRMSCSTWPRQKQYRPLKLVRFFSTVWFLCNYTKWIPKNSLWHRDSDNYPAIIPVSIHQWLVNWEPCTARAEVLRTILWQWVVLDPWRVHSFQMPWYYRYSLSVDCKHQALTLRLFKDRKQYIIHAAQGQWGTFNLFLSYFT